MALILALIAAAIGQNLALVTRPSADCGLNPINIHFLLDASGSVGQRNFDKQLQFVNNFIDPFTIGPNDAQFGVTTFDTTPANQFWLNTYANKTSLKAAVASVPYTGQYTFTHLALDFVRTKAYTAAHGGRNGVGNILILITDGESQNSALTLAAAKKVHDAGIVVLGVGVGAGFNEKEVRGVATDPSRYFTVKNYDLLNVILDQLRTKACEVCPFWTGTNAIMLEGKCLRLFDAPASTYAEAEALCEAEGEDVKLISLTSEAIRQYVQDEVANSGFRTWIGGTDSAQEGTFLFANGSPATFDPSWWGKGQPDDNSGRENCVIVRPFDGQLNDYGCNWKLSFFCESVEYRQVP